MNEWDKYREELERSKHDYCLYGPASLKLTLTPIIEDFNLPLDENSYWIIQHWQAMPRPQIPEDEKREFGWFICKAGKLDYKTIPAEMIEIEKGVEIIPLQHRRKFVPGRNPVAVNYFPNTILTVRSNKFFIQQWREVQ